MPISPSNNSSTELPSDSSSDSSSSSSNDSLTDTSSEALFSRGISEFNTQAFYACHDTLEAIWMTAETTEKPFYQGILQIAVAFYHLGNLNWRGGAILLGEGLNRLRRFEPEHRGVAVESLVDDAVEWLELVQASGEEGLAALMAAPPRSLPQIERTIA